MKVGELRKILEKVEDDKEIWIVSREYEIEDDMWWSHDFQSDISQIIIDDYDEVYVKIDTNTFD